jgi:putative AlgH/UPF0301 family transcriptional regulator
MVAQAEHRCCTLNISQAFKSKMFVIYAHWTPGQFKSEVDELDTIHPNTPHMQPQTTMLENLQ